MKEASCLTAALLIAAALPAQSQIWNKNLAINGDAEAGQGMSALDPAQVVNSIPGWKTTGAFTVMQYGENTGGLRSYDSGPVDRGNNYFVGGYGGNTSSAVQTIDLSAGGAEIDAGRVRFYVSAFLGMADYGASTKSPVLTATFKDAKGAVLLTSVVKGPTALEGPYFQQRATSGFLLPNVRSVDLLLELTDPGAQAVNGSGFNFSAADNLSLMLTLEPVLGQNLVVNGDAETSPAKDGSMDRRYPIPGWNAVNSWPTQIWVDRTDLSSNTSHLFLGDARATSSITQTIDVTLAKDRIDAGSVSCHLSADLGGDYRETIADSVTSEFLDANGKMLGNAKVAISTADLPQDFVILSRAADSPVPSGTRSIRVTLTLTEVENSGDALWADNISMVLNSVTGPVTLTSISNAATGTTGAVAPGEMVILAVSGVNLNSAVQMQIDSTGLVSTSLGNVLVYFDGWKAPLLYVNSSQIEAVVPFEVDGATSTVVHVEYQGVKSNHLTANVAAAAPGVFSQPPAGNTAGLIFDSQWALVTSSNRAAKGSTVTIVFTGAGQTTPPGIDGHIDTMSQEQPKQAVSVKIDGQTADLLYAGTVPFSWDGLTMAQVKVPSGAGTANAVPVVVTVGNASSPATASTMWVK